MDFFLIAAFVVSNGENLTKAHARFLESQLVRLAREAGSVKVMNVTEPEFGRLPEADRSDMAAFLDRVRRLPAEWCASVEPSQFIWS